MTEKARKTAYNWIKSANNDIKLVERELKFVDEEILVNIICFHCQQAAEKLLKAFLIYHQIEFPRTHNLEILIELCSRKDVSFVNIDCKGLTEYAVDVRYPDDFYSPTLQEAKLAYDKVLKIRQLISTILKV
jgi:HEPN domain-containing protein